MLCRVTENRFECPSTAVSLNNTQELCGSENLLHYRLRTMSWHHKHCETIRIESILIKITVCAHMDISWRPYTLDWSVERISSSIRGTVLGLIIPWNASTGLFSLPLRSGQNEAERRTFLSAETTRHSAAAEGKLISQKHWLKDSEPLVGRTFKLNKHLIK